MDPEEPPLPFSTIRRLHINTQHAQKDEMIRYLKKWRHLLHPVLDNLLRVCMCQEVAPSQPKAVANKTTISIRTLLSHIMMDVVYIEGTPCLHIIDRATTFSVVAALPSMQIRTFDTRWRAVFGTPLTIQADQEYNNEDFFNFCQAIGTKLTIVPTEAHNTQGEVERANGILKAFFKRIRKDRPDLNLESSLVLETFGKNECFGNKSASAFEMQFNRMPPNLTEGVGAKKVPSSIIETYLRCRDKRRLNFAASSKEGHSEIIKEGDYAKYYRERDYEWHGPALVVALQGGTVVLKDNDRLATADIRSIRRTSSLLKSYEDVTEVVEEPSQELSRPVAEVRHASRPQLRRSVRLAATRGHATQLRSRNHATHYFLSSVPFLKRQNIASEHKCFAAYEKEKTSRLERVP